MSSSAMVLLLIDRPRPVWSLFALIGCVVVAAVGLYQRLRAAPEKAAPSH
ncbi:hypothetical protein [Acidovorax cavernicola]|nr:hypothetical protein [Acidovorax cavernicola]